MPTGVYIHKPLTEIHKLNIGKANKGRVVSLETRRKISDAEKGKFVTEETKKRISEARKGCISPMEGKHHTDETKKIIGEKSRGKILSDETKEKMSEGHRREKAYNWKGEKGRYKYLALHTQIRRKLGKPKKCSICGKSELNGKKIHWCNKDHEYRTVREDWFRACSECHGKYDAEHKLRIHSF